METIIYCFCFKLQTYFSVRFQFQTFQRSRYATCVLNERIYVLDLALNHVVNTVSSTLKQSLVLLISFGGRVVGSYRFHLGTFSVAFSHWDRMP